MLSMWVLAWLGCWWLRRRWVCGRDVAAATAAADDDEEDGVWFRSEARRESFKAANDLASSLLLSAAFACALSSWPLQPSELLDLERTKNLLRFISSTGERGNEVICVYDLLLLMLLLLLLPLLLVFLLLSLTWSKLIGDFWLMLVLLFLYVSISTSSQTFLALKCT